ncbi:hypothetical protein FBU30_003641 [Linnemannia zychae]|nr:hypothetical protein FBU30_003641 [Linnemannia zychae]
MAYTVRFVETPEDLAKCHDVRLKVFSDEQGYDRDIEIDEYSPTVGKVGRVAVLSNTRGAGLGRLIMEALEAYVMEKIPEIQKLALSSQVPRKGFYEKFGYVASGDEYLDEGQPHIYMEKMLPSRK